MAILSLTSTHPKFSFIIGKNPASGMMIKSIRQGLAYGWFTDDKTFNIYFKDADNEVSYTKEKEEKFEYLNVSRYNAPIFNLNALSEFYATALKGEHLEDVSGYHHQVFINMMHIERARFLTIFTKHFPECDFDFKEVAHKNYQITISTKEKLSYLLQMLHVFSVFMSLFAPTYLDLSASSIEKALRAIHAVDAPFYIRNLFAVNVLKKRKEFNAYKKQLETTNRYDIQLVYGATSTQRREFITDLLTFERSILDIGCGEGAYAIPLSQKIEAHPYYAIDIDEEVLASAKKRAVRKEITNIQFFSDCGAFKKGYDERKIDIICTEVIEHMPQKAAESLIKDLLTHCNFENLIITTPNKDFNQFYELTDEFRHPDHHWEMGEDAFKGWLEPLLTQKDVTVKWLKIGDTVNGISTTQGVHVKKKGGMKHDD